MSAPFVEPAEPTAADAIAAIGDELSLFEDDEMERLRFVMDMGRTLPPFPDTWKDDRHRVPGCQSKVWLETEQRDGRLYVAGASDAPLVHGLVALVLRVYSLTPNRGNGVVVMASKIQALAREAAPA